METLVADFYTGFEGEPEVKFVRTGKAEHTLIAWDGYFSELMDAIEPGPDGNWQGLLLHYHLNTGWYDDEDFEVENLSLFASQLSMLDASAFESMTSKFYSTLFSFVQDAINQNERMYIRYF